MKKLIIALTAAACVASLATAEEAKKEVGPKTSIEFTQQMDAESVDGSPAAATADVYGTDAGYAKTELKAGATWDLGNDMTLGFALKDSVENRMNPATNWLDKVRVRNRFTPGLSFAKKIMPAFNVGLGLEYRLGSDLRTDKVAATDTNPEHRFSVIPSFSGKVAMIDYSVAQNVNFYQLSDPNGTDADNNYLELDGTYGVSTKFDFSESAILKLSLTDRFIYATVSQAEDDLNQVASTWNTATLKAALQNGSFTPSAGAFYTNINVKKDFNSANVLGCFVGADFTKGNWSLGGRYDIGSNTGFETAKGVDGDDQIESHLSVILKIKA